MNGNISVNVTNVNIFKDKIDSSDDNVTRRPANYRQIQGEVLKFPPFPFSHQLKFDQTL